MNKLNYKQIATIIDLLDQHISALRAAPKTSKPSTGLVDDNDTPAYMRSGDGTVVNDAVNKKVDMYNEIREVFLDAVSNFNLYLGVEQTGKTTVNYNETDSTNSIFKK